jgi:hypothetical protein
MRLQADVRPNAAAAFPLSDAAIPGYTVRLKSELVQAYGVALEKALLRPGNGFFPDAFKKTAANTGFAEYRPILANGPICSRSLGSGPRWRPVLKDASAKGGAPDFSNPPGPAGFFQVRYYWVAVEFSCLSTPTRRTRSVLGERTTRGPGAGKPSRSRDLEPLGIPREDGRSFPFTRKAPYGKPLGPRAV